MATNSTQLRGTFNEEQRYSQHVEKQKTEHARQLRELEKEHEEQIGATVERYKNEKKAIEGSFDVSISEESKRQAERLSELRESHNEEYAAEKKKLDADFEKLTSRERARTESYQKKQEENLAKLHAKYQAAQDELRRQNGES